MQKIFYKLFYFVIIVVTIAIGTYSIHQMLKNENSTVLIYQALPVYIAIITFFAKCLMDTFKECNDNKKFWFRNYILKQYLGIFNNFIDNTKQLLEDSRITKQKILIQDIPISQHQILIKEEFSKISDAYTLKWGECISSLEFLKIYKDKLYEKCEAIISQLQDDFMNIVDYEENCIKEFQNDIYFPKLEQQRTELLKILYEESMK